MNKRIFLVLVLAATARADTRHVVPCETECNTVSQSMWPVIKGGEKVRIEPITWDEIETGKDGTLIEYWDPHQRKNIGHRVVRKYTWKGVNYVVCKGDANREQDQWPVPEKMINGRVVVLSK